MMFPNEKHEFFAGRQVAHRAGQWQWAPHQGRLAGCTLSWSAKKSGLECCLFFVGQPTLLFSVQSAKNSHFSFGNTTLQPGRPAGPPVSVILSSLFGSASVY